MTRPLPQALLTLIALLTMSVPALTQTIKKRPASQARSERAAAEDERTRTREEFIKATKEYKSSLEKLLLINQKNARQIEESLTKLKDLYNEGLVARRVVEEKERELGQAQAEVAKVSQQINTAETQIAGTLLEAEAEEQMAKAGPVPRGRLVRTTSYLRYNGTASWSLSDAWKVERFFQERFGRALPVGAFGQSSIHNRWRLDHREAMDISVNPNGVEGQALIDFLRNSGIPFSAFSGAIPGTATGPHIHVGRPSHKF